MRLKPVILLILALGCGLVASIGINQTLARRRAVAQVNTETSSIFVAIADIEMGAPIDSQVVKLEEWPKDKLPVGTISRFEDMDGRRTRTKIYAGEPILEFKLLSKGAGDGATALIPKGYRVVSVRVDDVSGGSSLILPGDRVDVLLFLQQNDARGVSETTTRTILQDVSVFAVNDIFTREPRDKNETSINARTVSLLVTPQRAEMVTLATQLGQIRLVMRSREDQGDIKTRGAYAHELLGTPVEPTDRAGESLIDKDLLSLLENQKQPPKAAPAPPAPVAPTLPTLPTGPRWKMLLLEGKESRQVEFVNGEPITPTNTPGAPALPPSAPQSTGEPAPAETPEAAEDQTPGDAENEEPAGAGEQPSAESESGETGEEETDQPGGEEPPAEEPTDPDTEEPAADG